MTEATKRLSDAATKGIDGRPRRHVPASLCRSVASSLSALPARQFPSSLRRFVASSLPHAFTLVELIISIGLVLIIMLGVNFVFKMTSDTITAGQSLNEAVRNNRAAQSVVHDDFAKYAPDGPALLLRSQARLAFRNRIDQDSDLDYNEGNSPAQRQTAISTIDYDGDNAYTSAGERATPAVPGQRSHRTDIFSFFGKGKFSRATGGDVGRNPANSATADPTAPLISDMSSNEAWIWYGHLVLPDNNGAFYIDPPTNSTKTNPGVGTASTNPNNFFASQWALGRLSHLLVEPFDDGNSSNGTDKIILDRATGGAMQVFIGRGSAPAANSRGPIDWDSRAYSYVGSAAVTRGGNPIALRDSRFDLIGTSIAGYRQILQNIDQNVVPLSSFDWYGRMMLDVRFETNPALVRPVSAATVAAQAPIFMQGCTQFTVEFAGDFVAQNNDPTNASFGYVTKTFNNAAPANNGTDGEIDFALTWNDANGNGNIDGNEQETVRKAIRWYGLPRDTTGDAVVNRPTANANLNRSKTDVLPLRDILALGGAGPADFEKDLTADLPTRSDYANPTNGMAFDDRYTCAWGPNDVVRPRMIRITLVVDDPTGRLPDGQTYEYVFSLPPAE